MSMAKVHLIFFTSPIHVVPMAEMAKRILNHHSDLPETHFAATFLVPGTNLKPYIKTYIEANSHAINFHALPDVQPPTDSDGPAGFISSLTQSYKPHVKAAVIDLMQSYPRVVLLLDIFATPMVDIANELNIPSYMYVTPGASILCLLLSIPVLDERIQVEFEEMDGSLEVPGISPLPLRALTGFMMNKKLKEYKWFVYHGKKFMETKGIITNTFAELEPRPLKALAEPDFIPGQQVPPVYAIGPVISLNVSNESNANRHECLNWLDGQPKESVVFLCFGSEGSFDAAQVTEMATGLELSGHRFLWALRLRSTKDVDVNIDQVLPNGFVERTKDRGIVWTSWVPQVQVLAHEAVGGFVTHCGRNSCLESLWFGVPMLGWPLYAEQHVNAYLMAKDMGIAIELMVDRKKDNFVGAKELERGVRTLMEDCEEGNRVRARVKELKTISRKVLEVGGSSFHYMEKLVSDLRSD